MANKARKDYESAIKDAMEIIQMIEGDPEQSEFKKNIEKELEQLRALDKQQDKQNQKKL